MCLLGTAAAGRASLFMDCVSMALAKMDVAAVPMPAAVAASETEAAISPTAVVVVEEVQATSGSASTLEEQHQAEVSSNFEASSTAIKTTVAVASSYAEAAQ